MKIAFVSIFKEGFGGGEGRVTHELAHNFSKLHKTALIQPAQKTGELKKGSLTIFGIESAGNQEFQAPNLSPKNLKSLFNFLNSFNPDIIHVHDPILLAIIAMVWAKMNNKPFIYTGHILPSKILDFGTSEFINSKILKASFAEKITQKTLKSFYQQCDAIIALNQLSHKAFRDFGYQKKLFIIPNGRDLKTYQNSHPTNFNSQTKTLTFVGHLSKRKNQAYLIDTLTHLSSNYQLLLVGKTLNSKYKKKLLKKIKKLSLKNVKFKGQIPHSKIPEILSQTHLFTSASTLEVQSLVIIEALASSTPVIGLSNETIDELINSKNGVSLPQNTPPKLFAKHVKKICNLPKKSYQNLSLNAQKSVSHLDWSNIIHQTTQAYQKIINSYSFKTPPSSSQPTLSHLVSLLTSKKIEKFLLENIKKFQNKKPTKNSQKTIKKAKQVSGSTWLFSALTVLISGLTYFFFKHKHKD